jgi:hypothetical protein
MFYYIDKRTTAKKKGERKMSYKCLECGHIFEGGEEYRWEETHGFTDGRYEKFSGCPICKSAYEKTETCENCGSAHLSDDLFNGFCLTCLRECVDIESGISYIKDRGLIVDFVFGSVFNVEEPKTHNDLLREWCEVIAKTNATKEMLIAYIVDDCDAEADDFAHWLKAKEVK